MRSAVHRTHPPFLAHLRRQRAVQLQVAVGHVAALKHAPVRTAVAAHVVHHVGHHGKPLHQDVGAYGCMRAVWGGRGRGSRQAGM